MSKNKKLKNCICEYCKKQFQTWPSRDGRFCSRKCAGAYAARLPKPWQINRVTLTCVQCGKVFTVSVSQSKLRNSKYCSKKCLWASNRASMIKTHGPNYKGGITSRGKYYRGQNWEIQRRKALKRDGRACQICKTTQRVEVHHIVPYRLFNGDFEAANDLCNLITLCKHHHGLAEQNKVKFNRPC